MNERMIQWLRRLLLCAATVICPLSIVHCFAQEDMRLRQICSQAENNMQIGRTDEARDTLLLHMNAFKGTLKRDALRMIAMSYLTDYDEQKAGEYVKMMLEVDPYYSVTTFDPPIFVDIVNKLKAGKTATVTTASNMEESLDEVPVPTTLITEEMIHNCGGRNLGGSIHISSRHDTAPAYGIPLDKQRCRPATSLRLAGVRKQSDR